MNILYTSYFERHKQVGGAEVSVYLEAKGEPKNNKVVYANSQYSGIEGSITYKRFLGLRHIPLINTISLIIYFAYLIIKYDIKTIHAHDRLTAIPAMIAGKIFGIKTIVSVRDYWFKCNLSTMYHNGYYCDGSLLSELRNYKFYRWPYEIYKYLSMAVGRALLKTADVVAISSFVKDTLAKSGISSRVVYNKVSGEYAKRARTLKEYEGKKIVLYAGRLSKEKGVHLLIDAFKQASVKDSILLILGDGPEKDSLEQMKNDNIVFLGKKSAAETYDYYKTSNVVVYPVLWDEPYGRVIAEAKQMNKIIIASRSGGITEQLARYNKGVLIDRNRTDLLRDAIKSALIRC